MVVYKIDRRAGGSKNRSLGRTQITLRNNWAELGKKMIFREKKDILEKEMIYMSKQINNSGNFLENVFGPPSPPRGGGPKIVL